MGCLAGCPLAAPLARAGTHPGSERARLPPPRLCLLGAGQQALHTPYWPQRRHAMTFAEAGPAVETSALLPQDLWRLMTAILRVAWVEKVVWQVGTLVWQHGSQRFCKWNAEAMWSC